MSGCKIGKVIYKNANVHALPDRRPDGMSGEIMRAARDVIESLPDVDSFALVAWSGKEFRARWNHGQRDVFDLPARAAETIRYSFTPPK